MGVGGGGGSEFVSEGMCVYANFEWFSAVDGDVEWRD